MDRLYAKHYTLYINDIIVCTIYTEFCHNSYSCPLSAGYVRQLVSTPGTAHRVLSQQLQSSPGCRICASTSLHSWNGTLSSVATATVVPCLQDMCVNWSPLLERHTEFCGNRYSRPLFAGYVRQKKLPN